MFFVGRHREIARIESAVSGARNVILRGMYGIGRTSLVREIASRNADRWTFVFADFSENGSAVCGSLLNQLLGRRSEGLTARQLTRAIASYTPKRGKTTVIVLDDVAKVTRPKVELLRKLHASAFLRFVAIVERFVPEDMIMKLRVVLDPAVLLTLDHLDAESSFQFFSHHAKRLSLPWTEADIEMLATAMHGYPLEMAQRIARLQRAKDAN